jgi:hypothetical protein
MITSRDRVEAIPAVEPPAPMVVAEQLAGAPGGAVRQPAGMVPTAAGFGGAPAATAPAATMAAGWAGVPDVSPTGPGSGVGGGSTLPGASPVSTGLAGTTGGGTPRPLPGAAQPTGTGTGAGPGGVAFGPSSSGHTGAGGAAARGRAGLGVRPGAGGAAFPAAAHRAGPGRLPQGRASPGSVAPGSAAALTRARSYSHRWTAVTTMPPSTRTGNAQQADYIVGELPLVAPAVIGETLDEQRRRLGLAGR